MAHKTYAQLLAEYSAELRTIFAPEAAARAPGTRRIAKGAGNLAERGERLVELSRELGEATSGRLAHPEQKQRVEAQARLLAQATAQLEVARGLLAVAEASETPSRTRDVRDLDVSVPPDVHQSLERLAHVLEQPLAARPATRALPRDMPGARATEPADPRVALLNQAESTLKSIARSTAKVGLHAVQDLLSLDPEILAQGVKLISQDAGELIAKLGEDINQFIRRIVLSSIQLILQAYDWVLALIGKDTESRLRQQVQIWIDELRQAKHDTSGDEEGLFAKLVNRVFDIQGITREVSGYIKTSTAAHDQFRALGTQLEDLNTSFETLANQAENFLKLLGTVGKVAVLRRIPQIAVVIVAIEVSLLGFILYSGYDHVDSDRLKFLDRVQGVRDLCLTLAAQN